MTDALVAGLLTIVLTVLQLEVTATGYWRRWLGKGYWPARLLLAVVPAAIGVIMTLLLRQTGGIADDVGRGLVGGLLGAVLMRVDGTRHVSGPPRGAKVLVAAAASGAPPSPVQAVSFLRWYYEQGQMLLDVVAGRAVIRQTQRWKSQVLSCLQTDPPVVPASSALIVVGEELASVVKQVGAHQTTPTAARKAANNAYESIIEHLDLVLDPLAAVMQRRRAAHSLGEVVAAEYRDQRWERKWVDAAEEAS